MLTISLRQFGYLQNGIIGTNYLSTALYPSQIWICCETLENRLIKKEGGDIIFSVATISLQRENGEEGGIAVINLEILASCP